LLVSICCLAQPRKSKILTYDTAAYEGAIWLSNDTKINGRISFNDNDGIVTLIDGEESHSFTSRGVVMFEYLDPRLNRSKRFYSLEFLDKETGFKDFYFFEVLKEFESFAVLMKIDRIKTEARQRILHHQTSPLILERNDKKHTQTKTIYFANDQGVFEPYLKIVDTELGGDILDVNRTSNHFINAKLFERYTGKHFSALQGFAKKNKLSFKLKDDLLVILDEYERMLREH
jgi:hypothetical protein